MNSGDETVVVHWPTGVRPLTAQEKREAVRLWFTEGQLVAERYALALLTDAIAERDARSDTPTP